MNYDPYKMDPMYRAHANASAKCHRDYCRLERELLELETRAMDVRLQMDTIRSSDAYHRAYMQRAEQPMENLPDWCS